MPLRRRLARAVSAPALIGTVVFAVVLVITAVLMVRGIVADSGDDATGLGAVSARPSGAATGSPGAGDAGETAPRLLVHVVGEVVNPGVVELPQGARVRDAIAAAGGATEAAVLSGVNLARAVNDGEQIMVPDAAAAEMLSIGETAGGASGGVIQLNRATAEQLERLPGVGPALAQRILEWRAAHGGFTSVDQLLEVSGIGAKTLERFRDRVAV